MCLHSYIVNYRDKDYVAKKFYACSNSVSGGSNSVKTSIERRVFKDNCDGNEITFIVRGQYGSFTCGRRHINGKECQLKMLNFYRWVASETNESQYASSKKKWLVWR